MKPACPTNRLHAALVSAVLLVLTLAPTPARADSLEQWGLQRVKAPAVWSRAAGAGVTVAVVDTGIDTDHPDLSGRLLPGANFTRDERGRPPEDDDGHGTHVSGAIAANSDGVGIAGVAPAAKILPVRALKHYADCDSACGYTEDIIEGVKWAVDNGAKIVNLSLGEGVVLRSLFGSTIEEAIKYAWDHGAIAVVAAGNDGSPLLFGSGYSTLNAVIVGATNRNDTKASYSNTVGDAKWGVVAPGTGIVSTYLNGGYAELSGTSMATPHVAGVLALLMSSGLDRSAAINRLITTADDLGAKGHDSTFGFGLANADASVPTPAVKGEPAPVVTNAPTRPAPANGSSGSTKTSSPASSGSTADQPSSPGTLQTSPGADGTDELDSSAAKTPSAPRASDENRRIAAAPNKPTASGGADDRLPLAGIAAGLIAASAVALFFRRRTIG